MYIDIDSTRQGGTVPVLSWIGSTCPMMSYLVMDSYTLSRNVAKCQRVAEYQHDVAKYQRLVVMDSHTQHMTAKISLEYIYIMLKDNRKLGMVFAVLSVNGENWLTAYKSL